MICAIGSFVLGSASALDLYVGAQPRSTSRTCQSYASVLALAAVSDSRFEIGNFNTLREYERRFRKSLSSLDPGNEALHTNWSKAMERLTHGAYTLELEYVDNIVEWMARTREATMFSSGVDSVVATLTGSGFNTILTSVVQIDGSNYDGGHIVTVLGVAGSGISSDTQLIIFNSALKGADGAINR